MEKLAAENAIGHLVEGPARHIQYARPAFAADAVRQGQPPQQSAPEEVGHARRGVEEVDCVPGRRRVDHGEVILAARVDFEQALHRDVVVALREPRGEVVVQPVLEDAIRGFLVRRVPEHEIVPGLLGIEHRRPQLSTCLDAGGLQDLRRNPVGAIAETFEAERGREASSGIDGEHEHLAAEVD